MGSLCKEPVALSSYALTYVACCPCWVPAGCPALMDAAGTTETDAICPLGLEPLHVVVCVVATLPVRRCSHGRADARASLTAKSLHSFGPAPGQVLVFEERNSPTYGDTRTPPQKLSPWKILEGKILVETLGVWLPGFRHSALACTHA